jgi:hypothetical protein
MSPETSSSWSLCMITIMAERSSLVRFDIDSRKNLTVFSRFPGQGGIRLRRYPDYLAFFVRRLPPFSSRSAAWYLRRMSAMFTRVGGSFRPISSNVSAMI